MTQDAPLAAVVLAGGASRRMGRDKATVRFRGAAGETTFVEQVVTTLRARCKPVFVIAARGQALPELDAHVLRDATPGVGPLLATARGLRAAADAGCPRAFVCAVDMPYLTIDLVDELAGRAMHLDADVILPWDGRDHYLAGVYRTALATRADELVAQGRRSMRALVDTVDTQRVVMDRQRALVNVNSPDDFI
ncbi:molybdenum cofactor guanylyltransferase [Mycobacterium sp. CBMA293]|uniref:molybdenum cofactor guanylyltransferase n=1 Tax=unclassified Mycolicibacterium TaxID=2636767 RepID=UPI0012DFDD92|nr:MULTISPECIES: molybdenum cofactor guanylyltransferase [unclassified Mycolicibacterium]MUL49194.1 molybdenum cofactor guanylyltransferase [Mycolicibacterium sp. CBMA 360]MUL60774.1 molybdenum cofactor guanylyltransferase [Mycolicibacterium sp. CBMA 335]MUL71787.1 molybdenum cofactor guanylyltransferase [Mycolicibacterium sp. CBMA 311]MUL95715.1 molybdenum cofactor guanylyltransferase [Mycolicibacterium sp. CBMA 230]MUM03543.1 molybdenum cofactor guanylyltransferase [Mycolicibacterium sp. CBM